MYDVVDDSIAELIKIDPTDDVLYVSDDLKLTDGVGRSTFLADFLRMQFAAPTSCRSQLVGAEEFVFSRRLEENRGLAPSWERTLFFSHILVSPVQQYAAEQKVSCRNQG